MPKKNDRSKFNGPYLRLIHFPQGTQDLGYLGQHKVRICQCAKWVWLQCKFGSIISCLNCLKCRAGGGSKNLGGPALKDLDRLEHLVIPHYIESGKIFGGHGPPGPPVLPALDSLPCHMCAYLARFFLPNRLLLRRINATFSSHLAFLLKMKSELLKVKRNYCLICLTIYKNKPPARSLGGA